MIPDSTLLLVRALLGCQPYALGEGDAADDELDDKIDDNHEVFEDATADEICDEVADNIMNEIRKLVIEIVGPEAFSTWEERSIVDSGASHSYAPKGVPLTNLRPGKGSVTVATGKREPITELGDLGALREVRRVRSFTRMLVGVRDLVDQFHVIRFDRDGVHVETQDGKIRTRIGRPTANRLYSFNGAALARHARAVVAAASRSE